MRSKFSVLGAALLAAALLGCASAPVGQPARAPYPAVTFAVLADPHVYDTSLSRPGPAYEDHLSSRAELYPESAAILEQALAAASARKPAFVIICGDLTKDGEAASHRLAARILGALSSAGTPVFVVPGNHDILNPGASRYIGSTVEKVDSVTPQEFERIYASFGYDGALLRDPSSLSYVAQPVDGLWLLAIDSCRYAENRTRAVSGGRLGSATRAWIRDVLSEARSRGVRVIAFLHHGIVEHFRGESSWAPGSVVADFDAVADLLAAGGVQVVFSGHVHAQDVTRRTFPRLGRRDVIYDVATGSTCAYPDPWRLVSIDGAGAMSITSSFVTSIPGHPKDFAAWALDRLRADTVRIAERQLRRLLVGERSAHALAPQAADAVLEFLRGDEREVRRGFDLAGLGPWAMLMAELQARPLHDLQTDLPPADNDLTIPLDDF